MALPPDTGSVELRAFSQYVTQQLGNNLRLDGRGRVDHRMPHVAYDADVHTEARTSQQSGDSLSSLVYTDEAGTCISCTVHGVFGPPRPQRPNEGRLNVHVSAPFMQDLGGFTSQGGFSNAAITNGLADLPLRQVEGYVHTVLESCLDLGQLIIYPSEACWVLTVNITLMNVDGSILTAALQAAVAAFKGLCLPRALLPNGEVVERRNVTLDCTPVACTFGVMTAPLRLLSDPTAIEEHVCDGTLTVAVDESGGIVHFQQFGQYPLTTDFLVEAVRSWSSVAPDVRKRLTQSS